MTKVFVEQPLALPESSKDQEMNQKQDTKTFTK